MDAVKITPRIQKEIKNLETEQIPGVFITVDEKNLRHFRAAIVGPEGTPYEGGMFNVELFLTEAYPMEPPKVLFRTNIYHPNIDKLGRICLDILKTNWAPSLQVTKVFLSLQALLCSPNLDDPLDEQIADHFRKDEKGAIAKAKEWTLKYANN